MSADLHKRPAIPVTTGAAASSPLGKQTPQAEVRRAAEALGKRLKMTTETVLEKFSRGVILACRNPVLEQVDEKGLRTFKHDVQAREGAVGQVKR